MAPMRARGVVQVGDRLRMRSVIGSEFVGQIESDTTFGGRDAIVPLEEQFDIGKGLEESTIVGRAQPPTLVRLGLSARIPKSVAMHGSGTRLGSHPGCQPGRNRYRGNQPDRTHQGACDLHRHNLGIGHSAEGLLGENEQNRQR